MGEGSLAGEASRGKPDGGTRAGASPATTLVCLGSHYYATLVPFMTCLNIADRPRAGTHHHRRCASTPTKILYAIQQLTARDACCSKRYIISLHHVIRMQYLVEINAIRFELCAFLVVAWPYLTLNGSPNTLDGCRCQYSLCCSSNAHERIDGGVIFHCGLDGG